MNSHFSPVAVLLIRWTALLTLAWATHALLRNRHPRWRLILWRSVLCFSVLMPFARVPTFKIPLGPALVPIDKPVAESIPATTTAAPRISAALVAPLTEPTLPNVTVQTVPFGPSAAASWDIPWLAIALSIWTAGALWAVGRLIRFQIILNRLRAKSSPVPESLQKRAGVIAKELKVSRRFAVQVSDATTSPFAAGVFRPVVLLPKKLIDGLPEEEATVLMAHEIAHFRRNDVAWCVAWRWFQALCWPHPLIWAVPSAHSLACEEEADRVASGSLKDGVQYSQLLARLTLRVLDVPRLETDLVLNAGSHIARRLEKLKKNPAKAWGWNQSTAGFTLAGGLFLLIAACGFSSDEPAAAYPENERAEMMLTEASNKLALVANDPQQALERLRAQASNQLSMGFFFRGASRAEAGRFLDASSDLEQGLRIDPSENLMWLWGTSLLIHNGDMAKYQMNCKEMLRRFSNTTDGSAAEIVAKCCLWLPGALDPQDTALAEKVADRSVELTPEGEFWPWRRMAKGLAEYRRGQFKSAAEILDPLLKEMNDAEQAGNKTPSFDPCKANVCFLCAMAHQQLKETDQARAALEQGHDFARINLPSLESKELGGDWMNILMTYTLMSEADKTVGIPFQSQRQESPVSTDGKAPTKLTLGSTVDVSKMPPSHQMGNGDRVWERIDDQTWHEVYPDGLFSVFKIVGRTTIGQTEGTVLLKTVGHPGNIGNMRTGSLQSFIPDEGSAVMHHWFRFSPGDKWHENPEPMSKPQASPTSTVNKAVAEVTSGTDIDVSKMPHSYKFGSGGNLRIWQRIDDQTWHEVYPDGLTSTFKVAGRTKVDQTEGTVVAKVAGDPARTGTPNDGTLQAFIPDKGSAVMHHRFRFSPNGNWHDLAPMSDVQ